MKTVLADLEIADAILAKYAGPLAPIRQHLIRTIALYKEYLKDK